MKYTGLSLAAVTGAIQEIAEEAQMTFGALDERQLNWRPDENQWSVAQCFEHLVTGNGLLIGAAKSAIANPPTSVWQRLPLWPALFGKLMVSSQGPRNVSSRKYIAPSIAPRARCRLTSSSVSSISIARSKGGRAAWTRKWRAAPS